MSVESSHSTPKLGIHLNSYILVGKERTAPSLAFFTMGVMGSVANQLGSLGDNTFQTLPREYFKEVSGGSLGKGLGTPWGLPSLFREEKVFGAEYPL